jgi:hypothetical protein
MGKVAHAAAAEFGRHGDAEQAHLAQLAPQVGREQVVVVDLAARGAISLSAKRRTASRRASMSSESGKGRMGISFGEPETTDPAKMPGPG